MAQKHTSFCLNNAPNGEEHMELMLEIISRQKFTARCDVSYIFGKAGGYIGRSNECEWVLPDKNKQLSRKHALISCDGENFYIEDLSTNGIYTVVDKQPIPKGQRVHIEHGASYYFGEYTIQARLIHKPDAYISSFEAVDGVDLIPDDDYLDLDPLVAMEQQEEFEAKKRMGLYSDLLGATTSPQTLQDDHNEPRLDSMLSIKAIPEDWNGFDNQGFTSQHDAISPNTVPSDRHYKFTEVYPHHKRPELHDPRQGYVLEQTGQPQPYEQGQHNSADLLPDGTGNLSLSQQPDSAFPHNTESSYHTEPGMTEPILSLEESETLPPVWPAGIASKTATPAKQKQTTGASNRHNPAGQGASPQRSRAQAHPVHSEHTILHAASLQEEPEREILQVPETDVFFRTLGFTEPPAEPEERERILKEAAEMLLASIDGLLQSLRNRADSKNDLRLPVTTMTLASSNPLKYSPNPQIALEHMLSPNQNGLLPPSQAIIASFQDIHSHHLGILAGARAAVGAALHRISPEKVESKLDAEAPRRFNKSGKLWNTYVHMHRRIVDDPDSFADFFLHDFARAYEMQVRTLHPIPGRSKGE